MGDSLLRALGTGELPRIMIHTGSPLSKLDLQSINWVIVGGESGPGARPLREEWVLDIRDQCHAARVPFFSSSGAASARSAPAG